jgi:hypothetical protein
MKDITQISLLAVFGGCDEFEPETEKNGDMQLKKSSYP